MPASRQRCGQIRLVVEMLELLGQGVHPIQRKPQGLAHVAHGRARAIGDHLGGHARAVAAVFLVEILEDLLAALVLEIHVDVRGLVPLAADEPLEQHVHPLRIDRGDPQAIADRGVGRRAPALAQDPPPPGKTHQVPHREEIRLVVELLDQLQLVLDQAADLLRHAAGITLPGPGPGKPSEILNRRKRGLAPFVRSTGHQ